MSLDAASVAAPPETCRMIVLSISKLPDKATRLPPTVNPPPTSTLPFAETVQQRLVAQLKLAWAKSSSPRLAGPDGSVFEGSAAQLLSFDLVEMIAAYLPLRLPWSRVFEVLPTEFAE